MILLESSLLTLDLIFQCGKVSHLQLVAKNKKREALIDEILGTIMLVVCLKSICDKQNDKPPAGFEPFFVGITVFAIGAAFGINTGYAINPARDLGPRIFTAIAGWGSGVFTRGNTQERFSLG